MFKRNRAKYKSKSEGKSNRDRVIICVVALMIMCVVGVVVMPRLSDDFFTASEEYEPIDITILHVETFEGGKNTRSDIFDECGKKVQADYPWATFTVVRTSVENLEANILAVQPDMISFGYGVGDVCEKYLVEYTGELSMKDVFVESGVSATGETLAVSWSFGMYYIFQGGAPLYYGTENMTSTLTGAFFDEERLVLGELTSVSKIDAYASFVKNGSLIGTQRDVVRASSGNVQHSYNLVRMENYTDLVQYIGVTVFFEARMQRESENTNENSENTNENSEYDNENSETTNENIENTYENISVSTEQNQLGQENIPTAFIEMLTSGEMAEYFEKYYMFNILEIPIYGSLEGFGETNIQYVPNVFIDSEYLEKNQEIAYQALTGNSEASEFLWNMFGG